MWGDSADGGFLFVRLAHIQMRLCGRVLCKHEPQPCPAAAHRGNDVPINIIQHHPSADSGGSSSSSSGSVCRSRLARRACRRERWQTGKQADAVTSEQASKGASNKQLGPNQPMCTAVLHQPPPLRQQADPPKLTTHPPTHPVCLPESAWPRPPQPAPSPPPPRSWLPGIPPLLPPGAPSPPRPSAPCSAHRPACVNTVRRVSGWLSGETGQRVCMPGRPKHSRWLCAAAAVHGRMDG